MAETRESEAAASAADEELGTEARDPQEDGAQGHDAPAKKPGLPEIPIAVKATITCQADLDQVVKTHQGWIDGVLNPNIEVATGRANLAGCDLRGYALQGVNLSGANLAGANLAGCDLTGANLTVANLQQAILACANLGGAKLTRARLEGADLRGADLTAAVLTGVDLTKCVLRTADEPADKPQRSTSGATSEPAPVTGATGAAGADFDADDTVGETAADTARAGATAAPASVAPPTDPTPTTDGATATDPEHLTDL